MNSARWLWRTTGIAAAVFALICLTGFGYAVKEIMFPSPIAATGPEAAEGAPSEGSTSHEVNWSSKEQIRIVALGDSLTAGTGDSEGEGYVGRVREMLQMQLEKPVIVLNNLAIPGFRTNDILEEWDARTNIEQALAEADLVLFTIGGNDLFDGGRDLFAGSPGGEGFNAAAAAERLPDAVERLERIIDRVANAAPHARIMYVGLYHPFLDLDTERKGSLVVQQWNTAAFEWANRYPNVTVVPTFDLFELNLNQYLFSDHFHPNEEGYERIAGRIVNILE